jgi:ATP-binding cassette subfamily F protein uup
LQIVYFDQLREQLDPSKSVWENLAGNDDAVIVNGQSRHVLAYLQDFLFSTERSRSPVSILSGGERNRLLLAKLFLKPANLLVLDEPTNDLDAETLDLLENLLVEFSGTLLLVSHDRDFLDEVVTSSLVFNGDGTVGEFAGGYADWLIQKKAADEQAKARSSTLAARNTSSAKEERPSNPAKPRKLSFKEARELETLPERIAALESEQKTLHENLADPALYRQGPEAGQALGQRLGAVEAELHAAYARWEELETLANQA